jgi:hypothetical protein
VPHECRHRVLHQVEGVIAVARRELGDAQRAPLDAGEESIELVCAIQAAPLLVCCRPPLDAAGGSSASP